MNVQWYIRKNQEQYCQIIETDRFSLMEILHHIHFGITAPA